MDPAACVCVRGGGARARGRARAPIVLLDSCHTGLMLGQCCLCLAAACGLAWGWPVGGHLLHDNLYTERPPSDCRLTTAAPHPPPPPPPRHRARRASSSYTVAYRACTLLRLSLQPCSSGGRRAARHAACAQRSCRFAPSRQSFLRDHTHLCGTQDTHLCCAPMQEVRIPTPHPPTHPPPPPTPPPTPTSPQNQPTACPYVRTRIARTHAHTHARSQRIPLQDQHRGPSQPAHPAQPRDIHARQDAAGKRVPLLLKTADAGCCCPR